MSQPSTLPSRVASDRDTRRGDAVYLALREQIVQGRLAPGERVVESSIADALEVSRTPVRHALARLEQDGFLVSATGSRRMELMVAPLSPEDLEELWALVGGVEAAAVGRLDRLSSQARGRLAARLTGINAELRSLLTARRFDPDRYRDIQGRFHGALVEVCGGPRIQAMHSMIRPHVARYEQARARRLQGGSNQSVKEHDAIIRAIRLGNASEARSAVLAHWFSAAERTARAIAEDGNPLSAG